MSIFNNRLFLLPPPAHTPLTDKAFAALVAPLTTTSSGPDGTTDMRFEHGVITADASNQNLSLQVAYCNPIQVLDHFQELLTYLEGAGFTADTPAMATLSIPERMEDIRADFEEGKRIWNRITRTNRDVHATSDEASRAFIMTSQNSANASPPRDRPENSTQQDPLE